MASLHRRISAPMDAMAGMPVLHAHMGLGGRAMQKQLPRRKAGH
jgi:hypothetical protein